MFKVMALVTTLFGVVLMADSVTVIPMNNGAKFQEHKAAMLQNKKQRMQIIQTSYDCVSAANDKIALQACQAAEKSSLQQLKSDIEAQK